MKQPAYALGHTDRELERLTAQNRLVAGATERYFRDAGVGAGMRVLDVGSGAGDCAFVIARLVGETGEVIGTDRVAKAVAIATARARDMGMRHVSFREGDPAEIIFDRPFDAVVGRYVLLFQADAPAMLRKLAGHLRPGGVIAFHEPDWSFARSTPPVPLYDRCCQWIIQTFRAAGTDTLMGDRLAKMFTNAGLPAPTMRMQTYVGVGAGCAEWLQAVADLVASLVPAMEAHGLATAAEVDVATLADRLRRDVVGADSVIIGRSEVGAWRSR
jgi:ubiquinone/menaquinone biosynthesis C-methylase UbiE